MSNQATLTDRERGIIQEFLSAVLGGGRESLDEIDGFEFYNQEHFFEVLWSYGHHRFDLPTPETFDRYIFLVRDNGDIIFEIFVPTEENKNFGVNITLDVYRSTEPTVVVGATCHW